MGENPSSNGLERAIAELRRVQALPPYNPDEWGYSNEDSDGEYIDYDCPDMSTYGPSDCANWGWMYPDRIDLMLGEPCHGELDEVPVDAVGLIEFMTMDPNHQDWGAFAAFADWIMEGPDFPWAAGRPTHYEPGLGWYWSDLDLKLRPTNAIGAFLIVSRKFCEFPGQINGWHRLVQLGCSPRAAFMFSQYFFYDYGDGLPLSANLSCGSHSPFNLRYRITREQYLNYMRGNPVGPSRRFSPQGDYFGPPSTEPNKYPPLPGGFDKIIAPLLIRGAYGGDVIDPNLTIEQLVTFIKQQEVLCENEQL